MGGGVGEVDGRHGVRSWQGNREAGKWWEGERAGSRSSQKPLRTGVKAKSECWRQGSRGKG